MSAYSHGYTYTGTFCYRCQQWMPYTLTHNCSGYQSPAADPPAVKWAWLSDVRIADALERIAAALEAQLAGLGKDG